MNRQVDFLVSEHEQLIWAMPIDVCVVSEVTGYILTIYIHICTVSTLHSETVGGSLINDLHILMSVLSPILCPESASSYI